MSIALNLGIGDYLTFEPIPHCMARVPETEILDGPSII